MLARYLAIAGMLVILPAYADDAALVARPGVSDREYLLAIINEHDRMYNQRFEAHERANAAAAQAEHEALSSALAAAKEAVNKSELASEKRFDAVNEFRGQLRDQQATFIARQEYLVAHKQLADQVASITSAQVPRAEFDARWVSEDRVIREIQDKLGQVAVRQYRDAGASEGQNWLWGVLAGIAGLLLAGGVLIANWRKSEQIIPHRIGPGYGT